MYPDPDRGLKDKEGRSVVSYRFWLCVTKTGWTKIEFLPRMRMSGLLRQAILDRQAGEIADQKQSKYKVNRRGNLTKEQIGNNPTSL